MIQTSSSGKYACKIRRFFDTQFLVVDTQFIILTHGYVRVEVLSITHIREELYASDLSQNRETPNNEPKHECEFISANIGWAGAHLVFLPEETHIPAQQQHDVVHEHVLLDQNC